MYRKETNISEWNGPRNCRVFQRISGNFGTRSFIYACYILNHALAESAFSPHRRSVLATSSKYTLSHHPPSTKEGCTAVRGRGIVVQMREEVSLALSGMSLRDYVSQDSINLSTSSLFKGGRDFPSRRCLDEWLVKIRIRFLLFLLRRVHRARLPARPSAEHLRRASSYFAFAFHPRWRRVNISEATNDAAVSIGNWQI